jgi:hypothetical protein
MKPGCIRTKRSIVGWKVVHGPSNYGRMVAKLLIRKGTRVKRMKHQPLYYAAEKAIVEAFYMYPSIVEIPNRFIIGTAFVDEQFEYRKGKIVKPTEPFVEDPNDVGGAGIYFCRSIQDLTTV